MEVSAKLTKLTERFCKDCNIPIKIFEEPFFTNRLNLLDPFYDCVAKYMQFLNSLNDYKTEQDYFEDYNRVKDEAINFIKSTEAYKKFNNCDMNEFAVNAKLPSTDIYKPSNDGKTFISLDMKKANFSALSNYDKSIFDNCSTWEEFMSKFTNNPHIMQSKYIRQVILGNCNPKRHITYEKYLTYKMLELLGTYSDFVDINDLVVFFSNDEIVLDEDIINKYDLSICDIERAAEEFKKSTGVTFKVTNFKLHKIEGTNGYYKDILVNNKLHKYEFKCLEPYQIPFVIRAALGQSPNVLDKYFIYDDTLACFENPPKIKMPVLIH